MYKYFLSFTLAGEKIEREVSLEEFCRAEGDAGFYSKYGSKPATGGFGVVGGISGRIERIKEGG